MNKLKLKQIEKAFKTHSLNCVTCDYVSDEWFTTKEYGTINKLGHTAAHRHLTALLNAGLVKTKEFRIINDNDNIRKTVHYSLSTKK
jgi:DNA-binding transcriptional ArsR family regulator